MCKTKGLHIVINDSLAYFNEHPAINLLATYEHFVVLIPSVKNFFPSLPVGKPMANNGKIVVH